MNKLAIMILAATMTLGSGAAFAEGSDSGSNNGSANESNSPGSIHKKTHKSTDKAHHKASKKTIDHKKAMCKDGRCPDQVPGTNQSKATGN